MYPFTIAAIEALTRPMAGNPSHPLCEWSLTQGVCLPQLMTVRIFVFYNTAVIMKPA